MFAIVSPSYVHASLFVCVIIREFVGELVVTGNHESETMNQMYGFEGEVKSKYPFILKI